MFEMALLTNLLFALALGLTVTTEVDLQKRIIGGSNCRQDERPYHVRFENGHGNLHCGGSLISDRWILTAAHCWIRTMRAYLSPHPGPKMWEPFIPFPHNLSDAGVPIDIMLLELNKKTTTSSISLPDCKQRLQRGDVVRIAGYGSKTVVQNNKRDSSIAPVLQCANFTIVHNGTVNGIGSMYSSWCFAVNTNHVDLSPGDSGGGVVFNNTIYGVVQGGNTTYAHVTEAYFVDVCKYIGWIRNITGLN